MWGTFIDAGSLGFVFSSEEPDQVIKVMSIDYSYNPDFVINVMQYRLFQQLKKDQKQGEFTPGLPEIDYLFTIEMTPQLMQQIWSNTDIEDNKSHYNRFREEIPYGSQVAIVLMEKLAVPTEDVGRKGLSAMLRYLVSKGWIARDLRVTNKGSNPAGDVIWFDPMVAPLSPRTKQDFTVWEEWFDESIENYQEAIANKGYFTHEHDFGLFYSESENYWLRGGCGQAAQAISEQLTAQGIPHHFEIGLAYLDDDKFVGNHIIVVADNQDIDYYGVGGARQRWKEMIVKDYNYEDLPDFLLSDYLTIEWIPVNSDTNFQVHIRGDYLPASGNKITSKTLGFKSEVKRLKSKKVIVINVKNKKVIGLTQWNYSDDTRTYKSIPIPSQLKGNTNPDLFKRFFTAIAVPSYIYDEDSGRFNAESYPRCYLCGFPAKIEVMTAVGMRNFCSNKCRGEYEGVDYGDYDSPKLEHQLTITKYDRGYLPDRYEGRESKLTIDCANCPLHLVEDIPQYTDLYSEYRRGQNHTIKTWNEEEEDYDEEPCINHDLRITRYLSNSEEWDGTRLGEVAFRCSKCGYRDMIYADIPEGCNNTGRSKPSPNFYQNKS
jgi:hypothetical protein